MFGSEIAVRSRWRQPGSKASTGAPAVWRTSGPPGRRTARPSAAAQERRQVGGDRVDRAEPQRLLGRHARRVAHRPIHPVGVAAPVLGESTGVGGGVVHRLRRGRVLALHTRAAAPAADPHRRGGARRRAGRHGGDMRGRQEEGPGARRPRPARRDPDRHRHRRGQDVAHDLARRAVEAAGRVEPDHRQRGVPFGGAGEAVAQVAGHARPDRPLDREQQRDTAGLRFLGRCRHLRPGGGEQRERGQEQNPAALR